MKSSPLVSSCLNTSDSGVANDWKANACLFSKQTGQTPICRYGNGVQVVFRISARRAVAKRSYAEKLLARSWSHLQPSASKPSFLEVQHG